LITTINERGRSIEVILVEVMTGVDNAFNALRGGCKNYGRVIAFAFSNWGPIKQPGTPRTLLIDETSVSVILCIYFQTL
jgi:hypothetical protein